MLFNLGHTVITRPASAFCEANKINPLLLLGRHSNGDFGDLTEHDAKANTRALIEDGRIFSSYKFEAGKVWVVTESNRSQTTILLPDDY